MPRYTNPATGKTISSDTPLSDADLEEAFGGGGAPPVEPAAPETATTSTPRSTTAYERAENYLSGKVNQFVGAGQGVLSDIAGGLTGKDLAPGDRGWLDTIGDVTTVAAPLVAPIPYAFGAAAGAATRAGGGSQTTAELADLAGNLVTGGAQAIKGGYQAVTGSNLPKLETRLTGGTTTEMAGETLQSTVPRAAKAIREDVQATTYAPAAKIAETRGLGITPNTPQADKLAQRFLDIDDQWGPLMGGAERRTLTGLTDRLTKPGGGPITYAELDKAKLALNKVRGASSIRGAIDDTLNEVVAGTPAEALRAKGAAEWGTRVVPARKIADKIKDVTPTEAFNRTIGKTMDAKKATRVRDMLGADSPEWKQLVEGFYSKILTGAGDNPARLPKVWAKMPPEVRTLFDPTGANTKLLEGLRGPGGPARGIARLTTGAAAGATGVSGAVDLYKGRWQSGLAKLMAAGAMATGQTRAGTLVVAGALPPLAKTGVVVAGPVLRNRTALTATETPPPPPPPESPVVGSPEAVASATTPTTGDVGNPSAAFEEPGAAPPAPPAPVAPAAAPRAANVPIYPKAQGFVFHHSGGSTLEGLKSTLRERGLGSQYLMDRDGSIHWFAGEGSSHIQPNDKWGGVAKGLTNANAVGMEIVARDNNDLTPAQIASARQFIADNYPDTPVYGHGEINPGHKQSDEGMAVVNAVRADRTGGGRGTQYAAGATTSTPTTTGLGDREITAVANVTGAPKNLVRVVLDRESSGDPQAVSKGGIARGLMQLKPATFAGLKSRVEALTGRPASIDDPLDNLVAGSLYLKDQLDATRGNVELAARRYTGGPSLKQHDARAVAYGRQIARRFAQLNQG